MSRVTTAPISLVHPEAHAGRIGRIADYIEITKPRIVAMELVTIIVAAQLAAPGAIDRWVLVHAVLGAALVAASASAFNQWWERATDALMVRTSRRPLPAGRLTSRQVITFGTVTLIVGCVQLVAGVGYLTASVALATWIVYVLAYTPLKSRSPLNTAVGAVSGALPVLIGWTAAGAAIDMRTLSLMAVMFLWQFPHFMAIAWLHRTDYARAGQQMLTMVDPSGLRAGGQALVASLALIPVSLVPALAPGAGSPVIYCMWTMLLGMAQAAAAAKFLFRRDDQSARQLLRASLVYLTCWMGLLLLVSV